MNIRSQLLCAWCGVVFLVLFTIGWVLLARFLPPPSPSLGAEEVAAIYQQNTGAIRFGLMLAMIAGGLTAPWVAVIANQMRRIEGNSPVLTYTMLVAGAVGVVILVLPTMTWTVAAFRPERAPELILLLNDFGWLLFVMTFSPFFVQNMAIGLAIFSDFASEPVFPRWLGYFNIWVAILFVPGGLITFFKTGPFAWDGILAFWLPLVIFFAWFLVMFVVLLQTIRRQANGI
ncbi:MAG TPA: hypothetical protein DCF62_04000 [Porticoccaceae bacterium]|nr:hypothetical protein [Porticoccaceae bacterium]HCO60535.1 hypothetical protein [Porticoccaceae bacterium]